MTQLHVATSGSDTSPGSQSEPERARASQNGIVGHLGGVFSTIEDNHIDNIAIKREFYGYEIAGIKRHAAILGGDDLYVGNVFLGGDASLAYGPTKRAALVVGYGTAGYDGHPASLAEYIALVGEPSRGDHERFSGTKQPVYVRGNVYAGGAEPCEAEDGPLVLSSPASVTIVDEGDRVFLEASCPTRSPRHASASSLGVTSSACGSSMPTSRNGTAAP